MPSNYTQNCQLNQWAKSDKVRMADFNADNAKIDAAIKGEADAREAGDAALSARLDGLSASKAEASALSALSQTVSQKGNCQIITGSYIGTGQAGYEHSNTLTFPKKPLVIFIHYGNGVFTVIFSDCYQTTYISSNNNNYQIHAVWDGNTVSWYDINGSSSRQMNLTGTVYHYIALTEA